MQLIVKYEDVLKYLQRRQIFVHSIPPDELVAVSRSSVVRVSLLVAVSSQVGRAEAWLWAEENLRQVCFVEFFFLLECDCWLFHPKREQFFKYEESCWDVDTYPKWKTPPISWMLFLWDSRNISKQVLFDIGSSSPGVFFFSSGSGPGGSGWRHVFRDKHWLQLLFNM